MFVVTEQQAVELFLWFNQSILSCWNEEEKAIIVEYLSLKEFLGKLGSVAEHELVRLG